MSAVLQLFGVMLAVVFPFILIVFIIEYFKHKKNTSEKFWVLKQELNKNSNEDLEKEITALGERVIVLESIVTDRSYNLERKIGNL